ncbi:MAG: biopolymer transporter ExbD [Deferribacteres bacterium]|nr:biopolymer transporter ExbD [candidate division KSB1 bacterium]MCB9510622.1 biopolymer transporter ExbD [Deferribacteres bacterium]
MKKRKGHGSGNLMIRMIDIVFILLFGFIAVSQISQAEAIEPPKSEEALMDAPEGTHVLVIGVKAESRYSVEGGEKVFSDLYQLRGYIEQAKADAAVADEEFRIRVRAGFDAPIADCMRVAKLCRDMGIAKGIDVVKVSE